MTFTFLRPVNQKLNSNEILYVSPKLNLFDSLREKPPLRFQDENLNPQVQMIARSSLDRSGFDPEKYRNLVGLITFYLKCSVLPQNLKKEFSEPTHFSHLSSTPLSAVVDLDATLSRLSKLKTDQVIPLVTSTLYQSHPGFPHFVDFLINRRVFENGISEDAKNRLCEKQFRKLMSKALVQDDLKLFQLGFVFTQLKGLEPLAKMALELRAERIYTHLIESFPLLIPRQKFLEAI